MHHAILLEMKYNVGWVKNVIYLALRSCLPSREINVTFTLNCQMLAAAIDRNDCYPDKDRYVNECRVLKLKLFLTARSCTVTGPFYQNSYKPPFKYY